MKISKKLTALAALTAATTAFAAPLTIGDLCKIPPKSPKFPPRHLGDFS